MTSKETIDAIEKQLQMGDKMEIARRTGFSKVTINRFFNGSEKEMGEDTQMTVIAAGLAIIEERNQRRAELKGKIEQLTTVEP